MRYFLILLLSLALVFTFCSKDSTSTEEEEDSITLEINVTKNGSAAQNIFVIVEALIWETVLNRDAGTHTDAYESTQEDEETTNVYGKATFTYNRQSIPSRNGIVIQKVTIKELSTIVVEDTEDKVIEKNGSLSLDYEIQ